LEIDQYLDRLLAYFTVKKTEKKPEKRIEKKIIEEKENVEDKSSFLKINIDMESQFYQINILKLLFKWKFHLLIIVILAVILGAIFSGPTFITPKFKSYGVAYPANISPYSDESETEQMLQILQSNDIRDSIIKKFDLASHYEIDSTYKYFYTTMLWEYSQNVSINKTTYEGVSIEVMDKDPQIACDMVNRMFDFYNKKVKLLHESKFIEVVQMYERGISKKQAYMDSLENRFYELSTEYALLDYSSQSREIARGYLKTIDGSASSNINTKEVLRLKENIEKKGGEFLLLRFLLEREATKFADLKRDYERAYMDYDRRFSYTNIITKPFVADKKAYPVRWLIVVIFALASFFVAFLLILIIENYRGLSKSS